MNMNRIKELIVKYKAYIIVFAIAYLLGLAGNSRNVQTKTEVIEKPVIQTKEVQVISDEVKKQLEACHEVIGLDAQALGVAANISNLFSEAIPHIASGNVAEINKATVEIKSYGEDLTRLTDQKKAIIGTCKP